MPSSSFPQRRARPQRCGRFAALVLVLVARPAHAQIVNVQPLVAKESAEGLSGSIDVAIDWRTGNTELLLLSGTLATRYRAGDHLLFALARGELGTQAGGSFVDRDFEHLRYRWAAMPALHLEGFVQHDRDELRSLELRALAGAGPRLQLLARDRVEAALGVAYMFEIERERGYDGTETRRTHRLSSYAVVAVRPNEALRLGATAYLQPRIDRARDLRALFEGEAAVTVTRAVAFKLTVTAAYDREPAPGVRRLDTATRTSLQIAF